MKAPNISEGEWVLDDGCVKAIQGDGPYLVCDAAPGVSINEQDEVNLKFIAASKKMAEALESIRVDALRYMDDPKRQTSALWDIEATAKDALISAGYTEGDE